MPKLVPTHSNDDDEIVYVCGCTNEMIEIAPGVKVEHSFTKCPGHVRESGKGGKAHYEEMNCVNKDGIPQHNNYIKDLHEAFPGTLAVPWTNDLPGVRSCLEIGAGIGMYAPLVLQRGYTYTAVEPDPWAADWITGAFNSPVFRKGFEEYPSVPHDLILAFHVLEHLRDARGAVERMFRLLRPKGRLTLVVPNDDDPVNPDHLWFFTEPSLRGLLGAVGFVDVVTKVRKVIEREHWIYCTCRKP